MKKKVLGKGLSALINSDRDLQLDEVVKIEISNLTKGKFQPRKIFDEESIHELANSIKSHGIIQPIIVKESERKGIYEIIAGERRWRASQIAGLSDIPAIIRNIDETKISEQALIENIQRQNLTPVEESEAYQNLLQIHNYTQEELSQSLGKARSHIANMVRIGYLPKNVKDLINDGKLSFSHAKLIANHDNAEDIANIIVSKNLNVRQSEILIKKWGPGDKKITNKKLQDKYDNKDEDILSVEKSISENLGIIAKIEQSKNSNSGKIVLNYSNFEELDSLIQILTSKILENS